MLIRLFHYIKSIFPNIGFLITRLWYWYVNKVDREQKVTFMNYGYADNQGLQLHESDDWNRFPVQLYHYAGTKVPFKNSNVLEVGCGRGGGADYFARCFNPATMVGLDISKKAIQFCRKKYRENDRLSFTSGDALHLKNLFPPASFDVVVNIESSHRYNDFYAFLEGVYTVLSHGGYFLLADFRNTNCWHQVKEDIRKARFKVLHTEDITPNVVNALYLDSDRREKLIKRMTPKILHNTAKEFAGTKDTNLYHSFVNGISSYYCMVLQKPSSEVFMDDPEDNSQKASKEA